MTPAPAFTVPAGLIAEKCIGVPRPAPLVIADYYGSPHGIVLGRDVRTKLALAALRRAGRIGILGDEVTLRPPLPPRAPGVVAMVEGA